MGLDWNGLDNVPEEDSKILEENNKEFNNLSGGEKMSELITKRADAMAECLKDARKAYNEAKENGSGEDIRAVAITFYIDEGKNGRCPKPQHITQPGLPTTPTTPQLTYFKPEVDITYTIKVLADRGMSKGQYPSPQFEITAGGTPYLFSTSSKSVVAKLVVGNIFSLKKWLNQEGQTRYEVK